jgi:hypothetical protein
MAAVVPITAIAADLRRNMRRDFSPGTMIFPD